MDYSDKLRQQIRSRLLLLLIGKIVLVLAIAVGLPQFTSLSPLVAAAVAFALGLALAVVVSQIFSQSMVAPVKALWQAVLHLSPSEQGIPAPETNDLKLGKELVTNLTSQIYQLVTVAEQAKAAATTEAHDLNHNFIAQNLPLPLFVLDPAENIRFANQAAADYVGIAAPDMVGKNIYMVLDMSFPSEATFDSWLKTVKNQKATALQAWERVRLNVRDDHPTRLFDLAAYFNRDNPDRQETMLVLFDHTKEYSQDDQAISFTALAVHELRTPLTLLRGYIEVFEDEIGQQLTDPELQGFMLKMKAMAEQLTAFVNNILNVTRVDDDQLELRLQSEDWGTTLKSSIEMLSLQAKVRGITLKCRLATNLPPVGIDKLSIREVINNLIDNAIKYSGQSKTIQIQTYINQEGLVETTVQDFGVGIPSGVMPNLFTKFYRDHRNRAQIGGTGLGLYLSKAIVTAHGGNLWVRSKEGEGSTFGFTLLPYAKLAAEQKQSGNQELVRGAHGWIKNHSLYRR